MSYEMASIATHLLMALVAFFIAVTVHEYAHARAALAAGDDTAKRLGRLSLNPIDHLDTMGTIMFIVTALSGFGIAWGKPVPVNPANFRSPRWGQLSVSIWGPLSNIITAFIITLILKFYIIPYNPAFTGLASICIRFNLILAAFNMLPVPPLDGSKVLSSLLPGDAARSYDRTVGSYGMMPLLLMILPILNGHSIVGLVIRPAVNVAFNMLMKIAVGPGPIFT